MSAKTTIEWTATVHPDGSVTPGATWNPIRGVKGRHHCTKVSPACTNCYAERMNLRFSKLPYVKGADTFRLDEKALQEPLKWKQPRKIFVCSMTDLFHEEVPDEFIWDIFAVMALADHHIFQVLTKRPARMKTLLNDTMFWAMVEGCAQKLYSERHPEEDREEISMWLAVHGPLKNCWLGVTAETQHYADERIPLLLQTPAAVRFVSIEPMLGPVSFDPKWIYSRLQTGDGNYDLPDEILRWVIGGGESGPKARPTHPAWARALRDQCKAARIAFFWKQWGEWAPYQGERDLAHLLPSQQILMSPIGRIERHVKGFTNLPAGPPSATYLGKVGKKAAGRLLDGREWSEFPREVQDGR